MQCFEFRWLAYGTLLGLIALSVSSNSSAAPAQNLPQYLYESQLIETGKRSYRENCMGCHGANADGKGPAHLMLLPRPRNLVAGAFKFRTTPSGTAPLLTDIVRTLNEGVLGTSMPSFRLLPESEKMALALYIRSLRGESSASIGVQPVNIPQAPREIFTKKKVFLASAVRGKKIYMEACHVCHGDGGLGNGPGAEGLVDGEEQPLRPANLSKSFIKGGRGARDVFRAISTGFDGTPMPGFAETYDEATRWDLVSYVFFLRGQAAGIYDSQKEPEQLVKRTE
jgi:mono/diheme cytochrome c family protein